MNEFGFSIGDVVTYRKRRWVVIGLFEMEDGVVACWLRVDGGNHYTTGTTRELEHA